MIEAVIFDLDGVLIDSEPLWRRGEIACFAEVGVTLTEADCVETTGLRLDEVVRHWYARSPWPDLDEGALIARVQEEVEGLVRAEGAPMPGVDGAIGAARAAGLPLAVASTSSVSMIDAALDRLGVADVFSVVRSAEHEPYGKPHPAVFLSAASALGLAPTACVVIEDSVNGMVAAKAARMRCLVVPAAPDPRFALADRVLPSLTEVTAEALLGS